MIYSTIYHLPIFPNISQLLRPIILLVNKLDLNMNKQKTKSLLQQYYDIKRMFQLPLKIKLYFSTLQGLLDKHHDTGINKQQVVDPYLLRAFENQSQEEKISYLLEMIRSLQNYYEKNDNQSKNQEINHQNCINNIETSCQMESISFKLSSWSSCKFRLDKFKRTVHISNKRKNFILNLDNYFIRKSKNKENTIVFEAINKQVSAEYQKISLKFKNEVNTVIYQQLFESMSEIMKQKLIEMTKLSFQQGQIVDKNSFQPNSSTDKSLAFLTSQQITNYLIYKKKITSRLQIGGFQFKNIYFKEVNDEQIKIERSTKIEKIFKLECVLKKSKQQLKTLFLDSINTKYKYKIQTNVLQQFSKKYRAVYDKYLIYNKIYEQICVKEENNTDKEQIYFSKGLENIMTGNYLQFLIAKVKPTQNTNISKLIVVVSIILNKDINLEMAIAFLLQFRDMLERKQKDDEEQDFNYKSQQQFYSIIGRQQNGGEFIDSDQQNTERNENLVQIIKKEKFMVNQNYLTHQYQLQPSILSPQLLQKKLLKDHYFKGVWGRAKKGGILCINQQINVQQRKVVKKVVANLGANFYKIVKSGNFINHALPLDIFKKASHLEVICNNLAYAPLYFDRFYNCPDVNLVERIKYAILLNLSASNLGICYDKPFNPILGETLQCWIGGCPIYLQQISHHPPISYYYLVGRGYKIWGCIDPKIDIGLNSITCWSDKLNVIEFDDGSRIYLKYGKMITSGFIFGDRQFNYQDKTFVYDVKNNLYGLICFGAKKKGVPKNDAVDFVHGKIIRTSPSYKQKFFQKNGSFLPEKDYIEEQLNTFEGIWNQKIKFDGKQYVDFTNNLPYELQRQQTPLPSNSSLRKDLSYYIQDKLDKAQEHKEILEEIQRRDRKLREKYKR